MTFAFNVLVSALLISAASWVSGRSPALAGFMVALPLATLIVLPLSYFENGNAEASILLAKSIFVAVPLSLLFFLPFLATNWLGLSFWAAYGLGCGALVAGYFAHRFFTSFFFHAG